MKSREALFMLFPAIMEAFSSFRTGNNRRGKGFGLIPAVGS